MESENNAEYRGIYNYLNGKMRNTNNTNFTIT